MFEKGERHSGHGDQKSASRRASPITTLSDMDFTKSRASRWQAAAQRLHVSALCPARVRLMAESYDPTSNEKH
jgi:hypothetical protein